MKEILSIENDEFQTNILLLNKCNYKCTYCSPHLQNGSTPTITPEEYINFFSNLISDNPQIRDYKRRKVTLTGGEPSLYEGFIEVARFFKENDFGVVVVSNGSAKIPWWETALEYIDTLVLSFHPRYANVPHFLELIALAKPKCKGVIVHALMDPEHWERAVQGAKEFASTGATVNYKGILVKGLGPMEGKGSYTSAYTADQIEFLKTNHTENEGGTKTLVTYTDGTTESMNAQKLISQELNFLAGYRCDAGKSSLAIKYDGGVYGSACQQKAAYFGNLVSVRDLRVKLLSNGIICRKSGPCSCVYDLRIPKKKL